MRSFSCWLKFKSVRVIVAAGSMLMSQGAEVAKQDPKPPARQVLVQRALGSDVVATFEVVGVPVLLPQL